DAAVKSGQEAINAYPAAFEAAYFAGLRAKFGFSAVHDDDLKLIGDFFRHMHDGRADFTLAFRRLCDAADGRDDALRALFDNDAAVQVWLGQWRARLALEAMPTRAQAMRRVNPLFIPRNHRIEAAIVAAQEHGDFSLFETLRTVLAQAYEEQPAF